MHLRRSVKLSLQVTAPLLIMLMLMPSYAQAASIDLTNNVLLDPYYDDYDEVVNVGNTSSSGNPSTWNPTYQGVWVGSSTKESLYEFNTVTSDNATVAIMTKATFTPEMIMSGAAEFVIRSPFYNDLTSIRDGTFLIYSVPEGEAMEMRPITTPGAYHVATATTFHWTDLIWSQTIDMHDTSVVDADDQWTVDGRTYLSCRAPILPNVEYVFWFMVRYYADQRVSMYLAPNDVARDGLNETEVAIYVDTSPLTYDFNTYSLHLDAGISYDFRTGMGGDMWTKAYYMALGDTAFFTVQVPGAHDILAYHSVMVPFRTLNGTASFSVKAVDNNFVEVFNTGPVEWMGYILACSASPYNVSLGSSFGDYIYITITSQRSQMVEWLYINDGNRTTIYGRDTFFGIYNSYQLSSNHLNYSLPYTYTAPTVTAHGWTPELVLGFLAGWIVTAVGIVTMSAVIAGAGAQMMVSSVIQATGWTWGSDPITGLIKNLLDGARSILDGVGKFLWAVGEAFQNAIRWVVDQLITYGSAVLGLVMVALALAIFFVAIFAQLKLYGIFLSLAEGKPKEAAAAAQGIVDTVSDVAGKVPPIIPI